MTPAFLALAIFLQTVAIPEPGMTWGYTAPDASGWRFARLWYGVEGTENGLITIDCRPRSGRLTLNTDADAAPAGVVTTIEAGGHAARSRSKVEENEEGYGVFVETPITTRAPTIRAFRKGSPLTVRAGKAITRLPPLDPAVGEPFFRVCG